MINLRIVNPSIGTVTAGRSLGFSSDEGSLLSRCRDCWLFAAHLLAAAAAQEPSGLEAAAALENSLVETIAAAEKSVVAIARVRKEQPGDSVRLEFRPDPFGRKLLAPRRRRPPIRISFPTNTARAWWSIAEG